MRCPPPASGAWRWTATPGTSAARAGWVLIHTAARADTHEYVGNWEGGWVVARGAEAMPGTSAARAGCVLVHVRVNTHRPRRVLHRILLHTMQGACSSLPVLGVPYNRARGLARCAARTASPLAQACRMERVGHGRPGRAAQGPARLHPHPAPRHHMHQGILSHPLSPLRPRVPCNHLPVPLRWVTTWTTSPTPSRPAPARTGSTPFGWVVWQVWGVVCG